MPVPFLILGILAALMLVFFLTLIFRQILHRRRIAREITRLITQDQYEYIILDVRDEIEFAKKHLATARNIPFSQSKDYLPTENMFERIIVFGPTHRKARIVSRRLDRIGYFNATHFGAFRSWKGAVKIGRAEDEHEATDERRLYAPRF